MGFLDLMLASLVSRATLPASFDKNQFRLLSRGAYSPLVNYKKDDLVSVDGKLYVALVESIGQPVLDVAYWADLSLNGLADAIPEVSLAPPLPLGTTSVGVSPNFARGDHVHELPSSESIGAVPVSAVGAVNGVAELDGTGKLSLDRLPSTILGAMRYLGTWNAALNVPVLGAATPENKGSYYKVSTSGTTLVSGIASWTVGDMIVSNGTSWDKIDNTTDAVISQTTATRTGRVPASNELIWDSDLRVLYVGDGVTAGGRVCAEQAARFEHRVTNWALSGYGSIAHGLGTVPDLIHARMICKVAADGHAVGDEVMNPPGLYYNGDFQYTGVQVSASATHLKWSFGNKSHGLGGGSTIGMSFSDSNYDLILRAILY
jgi:hypothetical protein